MGFGTDLLGAMHRRQSDEFIIRRQALPAADVLRSATSINAALLDKDGELGGAAPGARSPTSSWWMATRSPISAC